MSIMKIILAAIGTCFILGLVSATPIVNHDNYKDDTSGVFLDGKDVIVQMFEWKYTELAAECERFLSKYGYGGIQVSPPQEHIKIVQSGNNIPWWVRYQPVSYNICSRGGTEAEFTDMVQRCNKVGVRVIVDAVTNHMVGMGQNGNGWCGSSFTGQDKSESFPSVPYGPNDFNDNICDHNIDNYYDAWNVRKCRLTGLLDIDQDGEYPRQKIADYFNKVIGIGAAGIRIDAAKHQYPEHLQDILSKTNNLNTAFFPSGTRPFIVQEVLDSQNGEAVKANDYLGIGRVTNIVYGTDVTNAVRRQNQNFKYFSNFGEAWKMWASGSVVVLIDDHDSQRNNGANHPLNYKEGFAYTMGVTYMLSWPYGFPRVMSSYAFSSNDQGPPSTSPTFRSDGTCDPASGWICEHRYPEIRRMTLFRQTTIGQTAGNFVTDDNRIAYSLGNKGWFAVNNNPSATWTVTFQTGLPGGRYCDIISGEPTSTECTGTTVTVGSDGKASISISQGKTFGLHVGAQPGGSPTEKPVSPQTPGTTVSTGPLTRTIVFIKKTTTPGQNLFLRGGAKCSTGQCPITIHDVTDNCPSNGTCGAQFIQWASGDVTLDWSGRDAGQSPSAEGTPMYFTTSDATNVCSDCLNKMESLGADYWKADMMMNCAETSSGWFELKGYLSGYESDISQSTCTGSIGGAAPYTTNNHVAKCGAINVFEWGSDTCVIDTMQTCENNPTA